MLVVNVKYLEGYAPLDLTKTLPIFDESVEFVEIILFK